MMAAGIIQTHFICVKCDLPMETNKPDKIGIFNITKMSELNEEFDYKCPGCGFELNVKVDYREEDDNNG